MERIRLAEFAGKNHHKVAAVFGVSPRRCGEAVAYLRKNPGDPDLPLHHQAPDQVTAGSCQKVVIEEDSVAPDRRRKGTMAALGSSVAGHVDG